MWRRKGWWYWLSLPLIVYLLTVGTETMTCKRCIQCHIIFLALEDNDVSRWLFFNQVLHKLWDHVIRCIIKITKFQNCCVVMFTCVCGRACLCVLSNQVVHVCLASVWPGLVLFGLSRFNLLLVCINYTNKTGQHEKCLLLHHCPCSLLLTCCLTICAWPIKRVLTMTNSSGID